jgi:hypothetical protein
MINLTIENCLEAAIHEVQNNWNDEQRFKNAQDKLFYLCCGIVAGLKANKQEAPATDNEEDN